MNFIPSLTLIHCLFSILIFCDSAKAINTNSLAQWVCLNQYIEGTILAFLNINEDDAVLDEILYNSQRSLRMINAEIVLIRDYISCVAGS
ncbi:hypothetical protein WICPIJ_006928 [Wickerhamomyces pijperi]|uniref:Uncharacterized protein n=1 Tax=Wickerhamomyces pijperi TaxID=599730 RepID=A0A9P8Q2V4_WICPI|nr:hypothetical protein WICPIJ_006928 [Wickerhamomyces pijperi]